MIVLKGGEGLAHYSSNGALCAILQMRFITPLGDATLSSTLLNHNHIKYCKSCDEDIQLFSVNRPLSLGIRYYDLPCPQTLTPSLQGPGTDLASFPGLTQLQFWIACSVYKNGQQIQSHTLMSGRQKEDRQRGEPDCYSSQTFVLISLKCTKQRDPHTPMELSLQRACVSLVPRPHVPPGEKQSSE